MKKKDSHKIDKRIQKTKKALTQSLMELILKKGYDAVSVQDILERANISRSTFYSHYENKEKLFASGFQNMQIEIFSKKEDSNAPLFLPLFQHVAENAPLAKTVLGKKSGEIFSGMLHHQIVKHLQQISKAKNSTKQDKYLWSFHCSAAASAVISLLQSWVDEGLPVSVGSISRDAERIATAILKP